MCVCHSLSLCAAKANELPCHLECLLRESRNWFSHSSERTLQYEDLYKLINGDVSPPKLTQLCATRWLGWSQAVDSTVKQWVALKALFTMSANVDKANKSYTARLLADMFNDDGNLFYLLFLNEILPEVTYLNIAFQKTNADITKLYSDMKILLLSLAKRFIKPVYLLDRQDNAWNNVSDGMLHQHDIDIVQRALKNVRLDNSVDNALLPLDLVDFGIVFKDFSLKVKVSEESLKNIKERCVMYLNRLCNEIITRIPGNLSIVSNLRYFAPNMILGNL